MSGFGVSLYLEPHGGAEGDDGVGEACEGVGGPRRSHVEAADT